MQYVIIALLTVLCVVLFILYRRTREETIDLQLEMLQLIRERNELIIELESVSKVNKIKEERDEEKPTISTNPTDDDVLNQLRNKKD